MVNDLIPGQTPDRFFFKQRHRVLSVFHQHVNTAFANVEIFG